MIRRIGNNIILIRIGTEYSKYNLYNILYPTYSYIIHAIMNVISIHCGFFFVIRSVFKHHIFKSSKYILNSSICAQIYFPKEKSKLIDQKMDPSLGIYMYGSTYLKIIFSSQYEIMKYRATSICYIYKKRLSFVNIVSSCMTT